MKTWQFWGLLAALMVINSNIAEVESAQAGSMLLSLLFGTVAIWSYLYSVWNKATDKS